MFFTYKRVFITYGIVAFLPTIAIFGFMDKEPFIVSAIAAFIINAIGLSLFALIGFILISFEKHFRSKSRIEEIHTPTANISTITHDNFQKPSPKVFKRPGNHNRETFSPKISTAHSFCSDFFEMHSAKDYIQFRYVTLAGEEDTYTLAAIGYSNKKIKGYCYERRSERSFFPDSIVDGEVIRIKTAEIVNITDWLGYTFNAKPEPRNVASNPESNFNNIDELIEHIGKSKLPDNLTLLRDEKGSIGIFKVFKNGKRYKNPALFFEVRNSHRRFLVNGDCEGKSFTKFDSAADYFNTQLSLLLNELEEEH